jgi:hypothetical protein
MPAPDTLETGEPAVSGPDPVLRRVERAALWFCVGAAGASLLARRGRPDVALGVLAGGGIAAVSYWAIRSGVDGLVQAVAGWGHAPDRSAGGTRPPHRGPVARAGILARLAGRYALLGLIAYVMIARFRLHPIGLVIGVSSLFVAAAVEAVRHAAASPGTGKRGGRGSPR